VDCTRPATSDDLDRLAELCGLARAEAEPQRGGWVAVRREARAEPVEASMAASLADPEQLVVVGEVAGYVVGYGVVRIERLQEGALLGVVDELYTEPPFREIGVGEAIMNELVAFSAERHCVGVDSFALPGDRETKNFFEGFGLKARAILVHRSLTVDRSPVADGSSASSLTDA
jgi:GNAT superfamily N-acetyltransferase